MNNYLSKTLALPALLIASQLASASVVLLEDGRFVTEKQISPSLPEVRYEPTSPFASWTTGILQNSQVTAQLMKGYGRGDHSTPSMTDVEYAYIDYRSIFNVKFEVQTAQILTLDFLLMAGGSSSGFSSANFWLNGPSGFGQLTGAAYYQPPPFSEEEFDYFGAGSLSRSLVLNLAPGEYRLGFATHTSWYESNWATWNFNAQFVNDVPLPASGWMLLSSIGSLAAVQRLRRHRKTPLN